MRDFQTSKRASGWRKTSFLLEGSVFRFSLGVTIPVGDTEDDPLVAGDAGLEHLHIQFGNGTFDPLLDFYFGLPLNERFAVSLFGRGRFPLYENDQGYQGSIEGTLGPRITWLPHKRLSFSAGMIGSYFGYSEWSARRDPNSGQFALNASVGVGVKLTDTITGSFNTLLPFYSKSFAGGFPRSRPHVLSFRWLDLLGADFLFDIEPRSSRTPEALQSSCSRQQQWAAGRETWPRTQRPFPMMASPQAPLRQKPFQAATYSLGGWNACAATYSPGCLSPATGEISSPGTAALFGSLHRHT